MSPTVFREDGYRFYFFSREEPRMHVHVHCADGEAKFWLEPRVELVQHVGMNERQLKAAQALIGRTSMRSVVASNNTSVPEVTNVSQHGLWLLVGDEELFLDFEQFPWFQNAPIGSVLRVEQPASQHLYWPDLDIDLAVESIRHPERFPLVSRAVRQLVS